MHGIAVDGVDVALFVVVEDTVADEWTGANDVLYISYQYKRCEGLLDSLPCWS